MTEGRPPAPTSPKGRHFGNLARRSARDWFPVGSGPKPGWGITAPKGAARLERESLSVACDSCSIRVRRRPSLDQPLGCPTRTARRQTHQSDIVFHASTLRRSGYLAQHERSRIRRPPKYGPPTGDAPVRRDESQVATDDSRRHLGCGKSASTDVGGYTVSVDDVRREISNLRWLWVGLEVASAVLCPRKFDSHGNQG